MFYDNFAQCEKEVKKETMKKAETLVAEIAEAICYSMWTPLPGGTFTANWYQLDKGSWSYTCGNYTHNVACQLLGPHVSQCTVCILHQNV